MSKKEIVVSDVEKEHDNPIAELVQVACKFDSEIILESNNRKINAKSIMGMMTLGLEAGEEIMVEADGTDGQGQGARVSHGRALDQLLLGGGEDEAEALDAMEKFLVCE